MPTWLRWLLTVPSACLAWVATAFTGMALHAHAERAWCPAEDFVSGYCMNQAVQGRLDLLITVFAGLSAVAVIGAAVAMAPARKRAVAWFALAAGGAFAALLGFGSPEFHAAVSLGALACIGLSLRGRRRAVSRT
ncbi:hypothetical protein E0E50_09000 [Azotobacter chroococcum subsp. isscasi]|uniref:hypothetical protein n=1 Tax=Azotobacter chroococcum TaxID=353 RepID=UPI00103B01C6|nr:hypothetical protein [Azotobacter chroococcum]TBW10957.1 hypothetical protein E0E50_09000 [Azotobacter chroococcum subsp. isscasi]